MALRSLATRMQNPSAAAARLSPCAAAGTPRVASCRQPGTRPRFYTSQGDLEKALHLKNNIESAKEADVRSSADLLAEHANQAVEAMSQVLKNKKLLGESFVLLHSNISVLPSCLVAFIVLLEHYWKDKADPDRDFFAGLDQDLEFFPGRADLE